MSRNWELVNYTMNKKEPFQGTLEEVLLKAKAMLADLPGGIHRCWHVWNVTAWRHHVCSVSPFGVFWANQNYKEELRKAQDYFSTLEDHWDWPIFQV